MKNKFSMLWFLALFILSSIGLSRNSNLGDKLYEGEYLERGQFITSENGLYTFIMQDDGNLVLYGRGRALWASNTNGRAVSRCIMQGDGNLVIYGYPEALWSSNTWGNPGTYLIVQNDGNVVIYKGRKPIWATGTN